MSELPPLQDSVRDLPTGNERSRGPFDRVLLAVDGEIDPHVIETALSVAAAFDASIHALSIVPMHASVDHWDFAVERREAAAERALDRVGDAAGAVSVTKRLRYGDPAEEIEVYADHNGIDLIVAGETEKTGIRRYLSPRSVTESLRRSASVPVLAVPDGDTSANATHTLPAPQSRDSAVPSDD